MWQALFCSHCMCSYLPVWRVVSIKSFFVHWILYKVIYCSLLIYFNTAWLLKKSRYKWHESFVEKYCRLYHKKYRYCKGGRTDMSAYNGSTLKHCGWRYHYFTWIQVHVYVSAKIHWQKCWNMLVSGSDGSDQKAQNRWWRLKNNYCRVAICFVFWNMTGIGKVHFS